MELRTDPNTVSSRLTDEDKRALMIHDANIRAKGGNKFETLAKMECPKDIKLHHKKILIKKYVHEEQS